MIFALPGIMINDGLSITKHDRAFFHTPCMYRYINVYSLSAFTLQNMAITGADLSMGRLVMTLEEAGS